MEKDPDWVMRPDLNEVKEFALSEPHLQIPHVEVSRSFAETPVGILEPSKKPASLADYLAFRNPELAQIIGLQPLPAGEKVRSILDLNDEELQKLFIETTPDDDTKYHSCEFGYTSQRDLKEQVSQGTDEGWRIVANQLLYTVGFVQAVDQGKIHGIYDPAEGDNEPMRAL